MNREEIQTNVTTLVTPVAESLGIEVVDVEFVTAGRSKVLRVYLDKPGGITLDDCADVSRELSALLDVEDFIPGRYTLEVSSPGLDRPLKKPSDFVRFKGSLAVVRTRSPMMDDAGNKRKTFRGVIRDVSESSVVIDLTEGQTATIPFAAVAKANLTYQF